MHDLDFIFWKIFCVAVKVRAERENQSLSMQFVEISGIFDPLSWPP